MISSSEGHFLSLSLSTDGHSVDIYSFLKQECWSSEKLAERPLTDISCKCGKNYSIRENKRFGGKRVTWSRVSESKVWLGVKKSNAISPTIRDRVKDRPFAVGNSAPTPSK